MKKIAKELPILNKSIRIMGDLMPEKDQDMPLEIMNELLDFKNDVEDFYLTVQDLEEEMRSANAYTDKYIEKTLRGIVEDCQPKLEIIINSGGGSVSEGFAIIDIIRELQTLYGIEVNTHAIGTCASMAVALYMVGDIRTSGENTMFMLHQISGGAVGSQNKIASAVRSMELYGKMYKRMFAGTRISEDELDKILGNDIDYYFDTDKAREWGIVNDEDLVDEAMKELSDIIGEMLEEQDDAEDSKTPDVVETDSDSE